MTDALTTDLRNLAKFGEAVLEEFQEAYTDIDGGWLQDKAVECGVLVEVEATEPCGDNCGCAGVTDFPTTCYRRAADVGAPHE